MTYLSSCEYVKSVDRKKGTIKMCGMLSESCYRIVTGLTEIEMDLCSRHATDLQQQHTHWKFYRLEVEKV